MQGPERLRTIIVSLLLAIGTWLIFWPVVHFDFIHFDDPRYVFGNPHVQGGFNWESFRWAFQAGYASNWHPLTWFSHMLDWKMFGPNPGGHHLTNLLLHIANSVLLFVVMHRFSRALWPSAAVAALFAWHPCHVESVAWISERKDVLSTFFFLVTLASYHGYATALVPTPESRASHSLRRAVWLYTLSLILFALGLMAKPMLVTTPFVLLLLDWWPLKRFQQDSSSGPVRSRRFLLLEKVPFVVLALISSVLTIIAQSRGGAVSSLSHTPVANRLANPLLAYFNYLKKLAWPTDLGILYPLPTTFPKGELLVAIGFLAAISFVAWRLRKSHPFVAFGWCWFLATLIPVIGIIQVGQQLMADRYTYIPSIGLFIGVCWTVYSISSRKFLGLDFALTGVALLAAFGVIAARQVQHWRDGETLFLHTLKVTGNNYVLKASLASYYIDHGQAEKAKVQLKEILEAYPTYFVAHHLLGEIFAKERNLPEAESHYQEAIAARPQAFEPHLGLGQILLAQNQPAKAIEQFRLAVQIEPGHPGAHFLLGKTLVLSGMFSEANQEFCQVLHLRPGNADAHFELAQLYALQSNAASAIEHYKKALQDRPDYPDALNNLAWTLAANPDPSLRNGAEAVRLASRARELTKDTQPIIIGTLAAAYAEAGRFDEAVSTARKACEVATSLGQKEVAARNLELIEIYRAKKPFHESPPKTP